MIQVPVYGMSQGLRTLILYKETVHGTRSRSYIYDCTIYTVSAITHARTPQA